MKSVWIRIKESREVEETRKILLSLIKEDETMAGDLPVYIYAEKNRNVDNLSRIYDLSEAAVNVLKERFGDDNVKCVEKEQTYEPAPKEPLEQIADNLGRIADSLETLTECIDTNYAHSWLNIAGTITNYE